MKKSSRLLLAVMIVVALASCKDPFYKGHITSYLLIDNITQGEIVASYAVTNDSVKIVTVLPEEATQQDYHFAAQFCLGDYEGNREDDYPPTEYVAEKMKNLTICRMEDGIIQQLPSCYYDDSDDFTVHLNVEFFGHEVTYQLIVTEEMFANMISR